MRVSVSRERSRQWWEWLKRRIIGLKDSLDLMNNEEERRYNDPRFGAWTITYIGVLDDKQFWKNKIMNLTWTVWVKSPGRTCRLRWQKANKYVELVLRK